MVVPLGRRLLRRLIEFDMKVLWLEMPAIASADNTQTVHPKYPLSASAVVVYRGGRAYVGLSGRHMAKKLLSQPDVRLLTEGERGEIPSYGPGATVEILENSVRRLSRVNGRAVRAARRVGLGDVIAAVTRQFGVPECSGCAHRRAALNRITVPFR
jgi:hypothetical protein